MKVYDFKPKCGMDGDDRDEAVLLLNDLLDSVTSGEIECGVIVVIANGEIDFRYMGDTAQWWGYLRSGLDAASYQLLMEAFGMDEE